MSLSRRGFITAAAASAAASAVGHPAAHADPRVVTEGGLDYAMLTTRGYNRRYTARPRRIYLPGTAEEVRDAVARSVHEGLRIAARSGGHCFTDFVDDAETRALIDLQRLDRIGWDDRYHAFSVEAGARLEDVYRVLGRYGVTVPAGICTGVGAGGHISGGGYGPLSRRHGLVVDHLYGVEVVTVDATGEAATVVATKDGPNRELWWAHTGGGGGNFGIVTRFLLRTPDSDGTDPARALPRPPATMLTARLALPLTTEDSFVRFLGNYLDFYSHYRDPGNRFAGLYAPVSLRPTAEGFADMLILLDADTPDAQAQVDEFIGTVTAGVVPGAVVLPASRASYADTVAHSYYPKAPLPPRVQIKAAYLRQPYSAEQLRIFYRRMADPRFIGESELEFLPFGGAINAAQPGATAMPARDTFMKMLIHAAWRLPSDDDRYVAWAREMYRDVYADTGGVPVPDERNGGSYINYPDADLADPAWNTSGVPWHAFYYRDGYPRLQRVKAAWDPNDVFRHRLSVRLP
ncbi:FAD-binding oxidoreductase [Nocardia terpenica]|uniref:Oxidoreductase n=1 Tax=Nocardia terpenica TaxID=455432 RepID=A0A291RLG1_9NOCA|nr:FAD-binding oxidoreductase [Nocardia terpenica]ATL68109.1 oxidoreductase [Nocardia terpenica]